MVITEIQTGVAITLGQSYSIDIPNTLKFDKIIIHHNTGTLDAGNLVANSLFNYIRVFVKGKEVVSFVGDAETDMEARALRNNRESNFLRNMRADVAENWTIDLPAVVKAGHNARIMLLVNTPATWISDGAATTYTGATFDIMVEYTGKKPETLEFNKEVGKYVTGANTGTLREYVNPTQKGFKATTLLGLVEDNGTPSDTAIAIIRLKRGNQILIEGSIAKLREFSAAKYGVSTNTGFFVLPINAAVGANELVLELVKTAAGTSVDLHYLLTSIR